MPEGKLMLPPIENQLHEAHRVLRIAREQIVSIADLLGVDFDEAADLLTIGRCVRNRILVYANDPGHKAWREGPDFPTSRGRRVTQPKADTPDNDPDAWRKSTP